MHVGPDYSRVHKEKIHNKGYSREKRHSRDEQKTNEEIHIGGI